MSLHHLQLGSRAEPTPRVVLAHGFTQNARCWGPFGQLLADRHQVVVVDAPGHGGSGHDDADLWEAGGLLAEAGGEAVYVGYSMGGRMALHAALSVPRVVRGLVLIGATAGLDTAAERAARHAADDALAARLLSEGLPAFLDAWLAGPLFASLPASASCLAERLENRPEGLAASLRRCGTGDQEPLWDRLGEIDVPVLVVVGGLDAKFTEIGHRLVRAIGSNASIEVVTGAGHAVHLEEPEIVSALIEPFVARCSGPAAPGRA